MPKPVKPKRFSSGPKYFLNGKLVSPEQYFIRTGRFRPGLDQKKAELLGTRFLGKKWFTEAKKRKKPILTDRQRRFGGKLPKKGLALIQEQIDFAVRVFCRNLPADRKTEIKNRIRKLIIGKNLSVSSALREKTTGRTDKTGKSLLKMRETGIELFGFLKGDGTIYSGLMQEPTGRAFLSKDWSGKKQALSTPIHEAIHILQKTGLIKIDVPFAYSADRLFALEKGFLKVNPKMKTPTEKEFDRKPIIEKEGAIPVYAEPDWAINSGTRIGQWVFQRFNNSSQRWHYLMQRCNGINHQQALNSALRLG